MTQLQQSGTFRGSDVDGLDRIVRTMTDAAEFADDVVTALRVLAAALEAMSWTGWAAAFARYLRAVVIPWVQTVAKYLRGFAQVLALISQTQKDTSADTPTVHIPDARFTPVQLPKASTVNAPVLAAPDPAVRTSQPGGGAAGAGAQVVVPVSIGSITVHVNGAAGGGAGVTTPTAPVARTEPGGGATGAGGTGVSAGSIATGIVKDPAGTVGQVVGGVVGGAIGHAVGGGTFGERIGAAVADEVAGRISGGSGGASGGGAPVPPAPAAIGGAVETGGATGGGAPVDAGAVPGDPPVSTTPVGLGGAAGGAPAGGDARAAAAAGLAALEDGGGTPVALAAAPLGLAALGAAGLGALRADGGTADGEPQDDAAAGDHTGPGTPVVTELTIDGTGR